MVGYCWSRTSTGCSELCFMTYRFGFQMHVGIPGCLIQFVSAGAGGFRRGDNNDGAIRSLEKAPDGRILFHYLAQECGSIPATVHFKKAEP